MESLIEDERDGYRISSNPALLDFPAIHAFLTQAFWKQGVTEERIRHAAAHSLCFGLYYGTQQVGYGRVVSDYTDLAYVLDVYVLAAHRGQGLGAWLMETMLTHPMLRDVKKWRLMSRDARGLYAKYGFKPLADSEQHMERATLGPVDPSKKVGI